MVTSVYACLGELCDPPPDKGVLSADGTSCSYASGRHVTFAPAIDPTSNPTDVRVTLGGVECFHYVVTPSKTTITTPIGTMTVVPTGPDSGTFTCPDGTSLAISKSDIDACPSGVFPGFDKTESGPPFAVSWALHGSDTPIFDCST
jgi:hypothetical protein